MVGVFYRLVPVMVTNMVPDTSEYRQISDGTAEVVKYGLIAYWMLLDLCEAHIDQLSEQNHIPCIFSYVAAGKKNHVVARDQTKV